MERDQELAIIRRAYAKQILAAVQIDNPSLKLAFAQVRREDFLGRGPWVIPRWFGGWIATNHIARKVAKALDAPLARIAFDDEVLPLDIAPPAKLTEERGPQSRQSLVGTGFTHIAWRVRNDDRDAADLSSLLGVCVPKGRLAGAWNRAITTASAHVLRWVACGRWAKPRENRRSISSCPGVSSGDTTTWP